MVAGKRKKLILIDLRDINSNYQTAFKIKKVTNTTQYQIGHYLSLAEVNNLIEKRADMTIEIISK